MSEFSVGDTVYFPGAKFEYNQTLPYQVVSLDPFSVTCETGYGATGGPYVLTPEQVAELQVTTVPPHKQEAQS